MATTETLRGILFDALEKVKSGEMAPNEAQAVCKIADKIIQTAKLEIDYSLALSKLDKDGQEVSTGPVLLIDESKT